MLPNRKNLMKKSLNTAGAGIKRPSQPVRFSFTRILTHSYVSRYLLAQRNNVLNFQNKESVHLPVLLHRLLRRMRSTELLNWIRHGKAILKT